MQGVERGGSSCLRMKPLALRSAKKPSPARRKDEEREERHEQRVCGEGFWREESGGWQGLLGVLGEDEIDGRV